MPPSIKTEDLVDQFIQDPKHVDNLLFVEKTNSFYLYQEGQGYYKLLDPSEFETVVYKYFRHNMPKSISKNAVHDFMYQIRLSCYRQSDIVSPNYIALKDVLLNLTTFKFESFDRNKITYYSAPISSADFSMPTPQWKKFLDFIFVDEAYKPDTELQTVVQEMFGYYLLNDLRAHAAFFLVGGGANGKSRVMDVLIAMIGDRFISAQNIESLTTNRFALCSLIGKKLNICAEEESKYLRGDRFKALISGDPISAERKYEDNFILYPTTKYLFLTNEMPSFEGINHGLRRRLKIIPFKRTILDHERDINIVPKLLTELPGIFGWAVEGAKRLIANNYQFSKSRAMAETMQEFEDNISSALMFFRENYEEDEASFIANDSLYTHYAQWCEANGRKKLNSNNFGKDIASMLKIKTVVKWDASEQKPKRGRCVRLKKESYAVETPNN